LAIAFCAAAVAACGNQGSGTSGAATSGARVQPVDSSPTQAERAATLAADQAADEVYPYFQELGALAARSKPSGNGKTDCKKLGEDLAKFGQDKGDAMAKSRQSGGGKIAVERAIKRKHAKDFEAIFDQIVEAVEVDCESEPAVVDAAHKLDL